MKSSSKKSVVSVLAAVSFCLGSAAPSHAVGVSAAEGHTDVLAYFNGNAIEAGHYDFDTSQVFEDTRLFVRDMAFVQSSFYGSTTPGFTTAAGYALLQSQDLTFTALPMPGSDGQLRNLLYWDGQSSPQFGAPLPNNDFYVRRSGSLNATLDGGSSPVAGFNIDEANANGDIHNHVSFQARSSGGGQPGDGYYLIAMQLEMIGAQQSAPIYFLFNADYERDTQGNIQFNGNAPITNAATEQLAIDWVLGNLLSPSTPGDTDGDGDIDDSDLGTSFSNYTGPIGAVGGKTAAQGDTDGDGDVDDSDLGTSFSGYTGPLSPATVPEPTSLGLWLAALTLVVRRRRASVNGGSSTTV